MSSVEDVVLRPMREEDIPAVMAVELRNYPFPWTAGIMRDCLRVGYSCWVCESDAQLVGYGFLSMGGGEAHILNISVDPSWQGRGLGRRLLQHLVRQARTHHADTVFLEVRPSNRAALQLYDSSGFNQVGIRHGYYPDERSGGREDALILALPLLPEECPCD